ncbi:MAG: bestrophin family protein [Bacteroidetes bacterium]|nr:bestrophin family protein [Bacteroidota bacterium]
MIFYKTNKNFFGDITHLAKSWTMTRVVRSVLMVGLFSTAVCVPLEILDWNQYIGMDLTVFSMIGIIMSILLAFRTNTAYDRWWEGRKQWGALVNHCRNLAITTNVTLDKENHADRHQMAVYISNFCIAFKEHLREGTKTEELIYLSESDKAEYANKSHVPNHISMQMHQLVEDVHRRKEITPEDHLNYKPHLQALLDILGACERIKKTPIPFSYAVYIKILITGYTLLMPFILSETLGLWTIPVVMFVFFAFIGIELMAEEIEDPFGLDCNDLPTGTIAHTIKENVFEILESKKGTVKQNELYEKIF